MTMMDKINQEISDLVEKYGLMSFTEALLLHILLERKGRIVTYSQISEKFFQYSSSMPGMVDLRSYKKRLIRRMAGHGWRLEISRVNSLGWKLESIEQASSVPLKIDQMVFSDHENGIYGDCFRACVRSILGLRSPTALPHSLDEEGDWNPQFFEDLEKKFSTEIRFKVYAQGRNFESLPRLVIAAGPTVRGTSHAVVWDRLENVMIHDPHPSRAGIEKINFFYYLAGIL